MFNDWDACMIKIFFFVSLIFASHSSYACKNINYDYVMTMTSKELAKDGCTKEHLRLFEASDIDKIKIVKHLFKIGQADRNALDVMAHAYYNQGDFKEALDARLKANKNNKVCRYLKSCVWYPDMVRRYENAIFYRAAGMEEDYEHEMWIGDIHFVETCPILWNRSNAYQDCIKTRNRFINSMYKSFGYAITWSYNSDGYLAIFNKK